MYKLCWWIDALSRRGESAVSCWPISTLSHATNVHVPTYMVHSILMLCLCYGAVHMEKRAWARSGSKLERTLWMSALVYIYIYVHKNVVIAAGWIEAHGRKRWRLHSTCREKTSYYICGPRASLHAAPVNLGSRLCILHFAERRKPRSRASCLDVSILTYICIKSMRTTLNTPA